MKISIANWVHRTIRSQERFVDARDDANLQETYGWVGAPVVGVYRNPPGVTPAEIVITEEFMLLSDGKEKTRIPFAAVVGFRSPEKGSGGRIRLELRDGEAAEFVIGGTQGRFEDVFEFIRFLARVTEVDPKIRTRG